MIRILVSGTAIINQEIMGSECVRLIYYEVKTTSVRESFRKGPDILLDGAKLFVVAGAIWTNSRPIISDEAAIGSCAV